MAKEDDKLVAKSTVLARGWTKAAVRDFLGEPDCEVPNPHYSKAAPMQLFELSRVVAAEKSPEFRAWKKKSLRRKKASKKATRSKCENLRRYVRDLVIEVPEMDSGELTRAAREHYEKRARQRRERRAWGRGALDDDGSHADEYDDVEEQPPSAGQAASAERAFVERIGVNYLRHQLTSYEDELRRVKGRVGVAEARIAIKLKVLDAISAAYPQLSSECARQAERTRSPNA